MSESVTGHTGYQNEQNSMLLKGIIIGGLVGGALALIDRNTRSKVKHTAVGLKDTSSKMLTEVKENPNEVKDQMISQFKNASNTLKEAIEEAQDLYQRVNSTFGNINVLKEVSSEAISTFKEAKGDLSNISTKVKEAGGELAGNSINTNDPEHEDNSLKHYNTGTSLKSDQEAVAAGYTSQSNYGSHN
ncbi:YtxH domain-containing protein [Bacillus sp. NEB1478]|uniref:YtxH domain-containing protein n=1 Tax=Bacillus sp. NEB1478 TaxID=3073816 RepID=UPI0028732D2E|nr:YtxH domain-containing protein [Bacillus sp. NEB1478]WNB93206.1 YtxH domain-containing protein [Bacillus sp. NEB1478]